MEILTTTADPIQDTFGSAIAGFYEEAKERLPYHVYHELENVMNFAPAQDLPFTDIRSIKAFYLLLKNYKLGVQGDPRNLYATVAYLNTIKEDINYPSTVVMAWKHLKTVMKTNEILPVGTIEEIRDFLPEVVYADLLARAKEVEVDVQDEPDVVTVPAPKPAPAPAPAPAPKEEPKKGKKEPKEAPLPTSGPAAVARWQKEIEELQFLIEISDAGEQARYQKEVEELQFLIDLES